MLKNFELPLGRHISTIIRSLKLAEADIKANEISKMETVQQQPSLETTQNTIHSDLAAEEIRSEVSNMIPSTGTSSIPTAYLP